MFASSFLSFAPVVQFSILTRSEPADCVSLSHPPAISAWSAVSTPPFSIVSFEGSFLDLRAFSEDIITGCSFFRHWWRTARPPSLFVLPFHCFHSVGDLVSGVFDVFFLLPRFAKRNALLKWHTEERNLCCCFFLFIVHTRVSLLGGGCARAVCFGSWSLERIRPWRHSGMQSARRCFGNACFVLFAAPFSFFFPLPPSRDTPK